MKSVVSTFVAFFTLVASAAYANPQSQYKLIGDMEFSQFCEAVLQDDVKMLKRGVINKIGNVGFSRKDVLRKVTAKDGVTCNGVNLIEFSKERQAKDIHSFLTAKA